MGELPKNKKPWTVEEEKLLIKLKKKGRTNKEISQELGRSRNAVHQRLKLLGKL